MRFHTMVAMFAVAACACSADHAAAQASVNENEPMSVYVNASTGSDRNPGSQAQPLATIQAGVNAAMAQNSRGLGVDILVAPGTYREAVAINAMPTSAPMTLQALTPGTVYIDGADVVGNWSSAGGGVYTAPWTDTVAGCPLPSGWYAGMPAVSLASEMMFINSAMLDQVMSADQLRAGTFYINSGAGQIEAIPPQGTDGNSALVEVASRRSTLTIHGAQNLVVRGLVLQHGASCMNTTAATVTSSNNILFDSDVIQWNNWSGLGISSSANTTVQNSVANHNGGVGLAGYRDLQGLWQNNETSYNNWRGAKVGLYDFGQGGIKLMHIHGGSVQGQRSYNNEAQGLWFDTDNLNIDISGADLIGNLVGNLQLELSQGPISVENSSFCSGAGVQILESDGISMTGNNFYNNGGTSFQNGQLFIAGKAGGRVVTNWETNVSTNLITRDMQLNGNSFTAVGGSQYVINTYLSGSDWSNFAGTLRSNNNQWYDSSNGTDFGMPNGQKTSLGGWQSAVGQDWSSSWSQAGNASANCSAPAPSYPDFQMEAHNGASYVSGYAMSGGAVAIPLQIRSFDYGSVDLSVSGLPSGVTSSFASSSLTSGQTVLMLYANSSAAGQRVPVTIFGTSGSRVHSITVEVAVAP